MGAIAAVQLSPATPRYQSEADRLRADRKASGYKARQVTVRSHYSEQDVTVRDAAVSLSEVATIAHRYRVVHRDHANGESLAAGIPSSAWSTRSRSMRHVRRKSHASFTPRRSA